MKQSEIISILYHDIFHYELSPKELTRWKAGKKLALLDPKPKVKPARTFKSLSPQASSMVNAKKLDIAHSAGTVLSRLSTVLFVGVTGSLAMKNAKQQSDIDLMIITRANTVWVTRLLVIGVLFLGGYRLRRAKNLDEKDKLCLNFWIDEKALRWTGLKNAYIAHEIAQVVPLVDKGHIHSRWLKTNDWVRDYWPNAVKIAKKEAHKKKYTKSHDTIRLLNPLAYILQRIYMKPKLTRESTSIHHAFFHPYDWSTKVIKELQRRGVVES